MTAYQIKIYQNDSGSTLMYDSGSVTVSPAFEPHDKYGNATYFTAIISAAALSTAGIVNGYQYGYKMLITQWWGVSDYVEQTSASVFITRSTPNISIDAIPNPVAASSITITATYSQAQGDPISTVEWVFALAGSESNPIRKTGAISTQVLSFDADGLITGNTYSIMCNVVTSTGMEASTGFVQFPVLYSSSSLGINYELAQLKNSSATYLSWDALDSNILSYPYTDTTKTTNGVTFTVNGEGDVVATGTATADAYFTIAQGTLSQLGITAGQKFIVTSGYSGAKIVVTETNSSNVIVSTISGNDPLQYIATSTTNTLKFSIVIPSGTALGAGQQLQPMISVEDRVVALDDVSVNITPSQDLHGYDHPWPGGGGKNKLYVPAGSSTVNGTTFAVASDGSVKLTNAPSANATKLVCTFTLPAGSYIYTSGITEQRDVTVDTFVQKSGTTIARGNNSDSPGNSFTLTEESTLNFDIRVQSGYNPNDLVVKPMIRLSSVSDATWEPYSNICPITGLTGLTAYRFGKNLFNVAAVSSAGTAVSVSQIENGIRIVSTSNGTYRAGYGGVNMQTLPDGTEITFSAHCKVNSGKARIGIRRASDNGLVAYSSLVSSGEADLSCTYTYSKDTPVYLSEFCTWSTSEAGDVEYTNIQLEIGSTKTAHVPYAGNTYSVDWTTQAGTVYHGTVDVVTGVLTVDYAEVDLGTKTYTQSSTITAGKSRWAIYDLPIKGVATYAVGNGLSSAYSIVSNYDTWVNVNGIALYNTGSSNIVYLYDEALSASTPNAVKTALSGVQLVYELETPLTYQLTAQEVAALVGTNNVWSDANSVTVTYTKNDGTQAILSGDIVTFSDSNAVVIPTPQFIPGITGISIYRYLQGESSLQHVYDLNAGSTSILDYYAPSQMSVSYLIVAHSGIGDLFLQTTQFTPTFWFYSILLCDKDSNGDYHVSKEYIFKYGVETGAVSNNNEPTIQKNFTPYPNRQPISTLYKTGKISGYIGKTNSLNRYSDSVSLQNAIYDISVSSLDKFLKSRKGDVIKVDTASSIQMKTADDTVQQALKATVDWVEVGDSSQVSIVSVPADSFWPLA